MHYRNGREAKPGDVVIHLPKFAPPAVGLLHNLNGQATTCNGRLAVITPGDPYVTLSDCLHVDDVVDAFEPPKQAEPLPAAAESA